MPTPLLRVDASASTQSTSRTLGNHLLGRLRAEQGPVNLMQRDLSSGIPLLDTAQLEARETPDPEQTPQQQRVLQPSADLIAELQAADILLLTTPIYNFSIPGALKAYIDQVCRPGLTFRYTENGPEGLLRCRAYVIVTSAGTSIDSDVDFATPYLQHVLGFMGIENVTVVGCDRNWQDPDQRFRQAITDIDHLDLSP